MIAVFLTPASAATRPSPPLKLSREQMQKQPAKKREGCKFPLPKVQVSDTRTGVINPKVRGDESKGTVGISK